MKNMMIKTSLALLLALGFISCSRDGWRLDYGDPVARLAEEELTAEGEKYIGEKIVVRGVVAKVDASDKEAAWVELEGGTRCHLGHLFKMAESCEIGSEVYLAGILKEEKGRFVLRPAVMTDPPEAP